MLIRRLLSLLAPTWPALCVAAIFSVVTIAANVGLMATSAYLLSLAALQPPFAALSVAIVGVRFFGISRAFSRYVERYAGHDAALRLLREIRVWFFSALEPLAPAGLARFSSADLYTRMVADVETLKYIPVRIILPGAAAFFVLVAVTFLLAQLQIWLALWFFCGLILMGVLLPKFIHRNDNEKKRNLAVTRACFQASILDSIRGLRDLSAFGHGNLMLQRFQESNSAFLFAQRQCRHKDALGEAGGHLVASLVFIGALALLVSLVRSGKIEGILLATWALIIQSSFEAFFPLSFIRRYWEEIRDSAVRIFSAGTSDLPLITVGTQMLASPFHVAFNNVSFCYLPGDIYILRQVSFALSPGKRIAVVGPSGAGKSTIIALLARLQIPESGSILFNDRPIREISPVVLQEAMGVVMQNDHIFHATIADNLRLAKPCASDQELWEALEQVRLGAVVRGLPNGMDSMVGDEGQGLSGGERRRLSLARALLKDPPILLLDEPAAGLDPHLASQLLNEGGALLRKGRCVVLVTHQLSGLQHMDEILVLDRGRVVEQGRWNELLAKQGFLYKMWALQQDVFNQPAGN